MTKYRLTIIIDDGSHQAFDVEFTFECLFPLLELGGCYVIEDLAFHFGELAERHGAGASLPLPQYIHRIERWLMGERLAPEDAQGFPRWLYGAIDRMEVIHSAVAIWKRAPRATSEEQLDQLEKLVGSARTGNGSHLSRGRCWRWGMSIGRNAPLDGRWNSSHMLGNARTTV